MPTGGNRDAHRTLSAEAVAVLRFEIRGWKAKDPAGRLPAYRELADAGIMEAVPGSEGEYRFTREGPEHGEAILEREAGADRARAVRAARCERAVGSGQGLAAPASLSGVPKATRPTAPPTASWSRRGS